MPCTCKFIDELEKDTYKIIENVELLIHFSQTKNHYVNRFFVGVLPNFDAILTSLSVFFFSNRIFLKHKRIPQVRWMMHAEMFLLISTEEMHLFR